MDGQDFTFTNCMAICCDGKHFIKFRDGRATIPLQELFNIEKCWERNIKNLCGVVCKQKGMCIPHRKLNVLKIFTENVRYRNINRDTVVTKIIIRENCKHKNCMGAWCFEIFETKWVGTDKEKRQKLLN